MSNNRFIDMLRQYAAQARRRNVSYAEPVRLLVELRMNEIIQAGGTPEEYDAERAKLEKVALREYGKFDGSLSFESDG